MHMIPRLGILAILGTLLLLARPESLQAQWLSAQGAEDERVVLVGLVDDLELPEATAVVIRRPARQPGDVILVTSETRPPDLAKAFAMLQRSRLRQGARVERELRAPITRATAVPRDGRAVAASATVLRALEEADPVEIDGLGSLRVVPTVTILPERGS